MIDKRINLIIVDDHSGVRKGIRKLLQVAEDIEIVGEAANGKQAIELAISKKPDIILLDIELPDMKGDVVLQRIRKELPDIKVLAISAYSDRQYVVGMMNSGASGYLTKEVLPPMLVKAIHSIAYEDADWIGPRVTKDTPVLETTLTQTETEILKQLLLDQSEYEIASNLGMEYKQVEKYLEFLMKKYQVKTLASLRRTAEKIFPEP